MLGHVLCAYCGCPPARHTKADPGGLLADAAAAHAAPDIRADARRRGRGAAGRRDQRESDEESRYCKPGYGTLWILFVITNYST